MITYKARIEAPAADVWAALVDVETWPSWASQFKRLELLDPGPLALGSRVRVRPNGLPASVWRVTQYDAGRSFTWESSSPGVRLTGGHVVTAEGDAVCTAEFWLDAHGPLGGLLSPVLGWLVFRRNTRNAAEGLKRHIEHN